MKKRQVYAAVLLIGDELLSGRTQDQNLQAISQFLIPLGIQVEECMIIRDLENQIIGEVNRLRNKYDYVFTTGGIGPTHDDITAQSIAKAFKVRLKENEEALQHLLKQYKVNELNVGRRKMAHIPETATLIENPVSGAPGFQLKNVFVLAGIPSIMRAMLQSLSSRLSGGERVLSRTVYAANLLESVVAEPLSGIQDQFKMLVSIGSYPFFNHIDSFGVNICLRSIDPDALECSTQKVTMLIKKFGIEPEIYSE